jgi:hypothetical protein
MHVDGHRWWDELQIRLIRIGLGMMCEGIVFGDFIRNGEVIDAR